MTNGLLKNYLPTTTSVITDKLSTLKSFFLLTNPLVFSFFVKNPLLLTLELLLQGSNINLVRQSINSKNNLIFNSLNTFGIDNLLFTNILPTPSFSNNISKTGSVSSQEYRLRLNIMSDFGRFVLLPLHNATGKKILIQLYSSVDQNVSAKEISLYIDWFFRLRVFERRLGHKFFLGEALNIMYMSFRDKDIKLFSN